MSNDYGILIVDDDARFAALAESVLAEAGYRCRTAASGKVALAAARSEQPGIVLLVDQEARPLAAVVEIH
jgi:DNA-binding response OmpR family regulator